MVAPYLGIPDSQRTVSVKILNTATGEVPAALFYAPVYPDNPLLSSPVLCFLIEHGPSGKRVLFDLGVRSDPMNTSAPAMQKMINMGANFVVEKDMATQLLEGGVPLDSINAIIWSHAHADHTGDPSLFPPSTDLIVGPGFSTNVLPLYPTNPCSSLLERDISGRKLIEVPFDDEKAKIAELRSYDYFGDGSFYLLDTPGHCHGHMSALARVTSGPTENSSTFILLGADTCHHAGQLRPSYSHPCPSALLAQIRAQPHMNYFIRADTPPLMVQTAPHAIHTDPEQAIESMKKMQLLDGQEDIFVILSHDASILGPGSPVKLFPEEANAWKAEGWKAKTTWAFLEQGNPAFRFARVQRDASAQ